MFQVDKDAVDEDIARLGAVLRQFILGARTSFRDVERRAGLAQGALTRIFSGRVSLGLRHIFLVLAALDYPREKFFAIALRPRSSSDSQKETLAELLVELEGPRAKRPPSSISDLSPDQLKDLFVAAISEFEGRKASDPSRHAPGPAQAPEEEAPSLPERLAAKPVSAKARRARNA